MRERARYEKERILASGGGVDLHRHLWDHRSVDHPQHTGLLERERGRAMRYYSIEEIGEAVYETLSKLSIEDYDKNEAIFWQFKTILEEREGKE
jgi:hypothetical protein